MLFTVVRLALLFIAGILINMCLLHFFSFMETRAHPVIARSRRPHLASALWATSQLALALWILLGLRYRFAASVETLALVLGFAFWGILLGFLYDRHRMLEADPGDASATKDRPVREGGRANRPDDRKVD